MTGLQISDRLLRSSIVSRDRRELDNGFERGEGTRPVTRAFEKQAIGISAAKAAKGLARRRPTTDERSKEIARRRKWAGGGNMPPDVRAEYSEAERAALSVIADQCRKRGFCDLCLDEIARLAGVSRTSVKNALFKAKAKKRAHISVRERPMIGGKNLSNIIKIVCGSWLRWITRGIGGKRMATSETGVKTSLFEPAERVQSALERECEARAATHTQRVRAFVRTLPSALELGWPRNRGGGRG